MDVLTLNIINLMLGIFSSTVLCLTLKDFSKPLFLKLWCCAAAALTVNAALGMLHYFGIPLAYWLIPATTNTATIAIHLFIFAGLQLFFQIKQPTRLFLHPLTGMPQAKAAEQEQRVPFLLGGFILGSLTICFLLAFTPFAKADTLNRLIMYFPIIMLLNLLSLYLIVQNMTKANSLKTVFHLFAIALTFNIVQLGLRLMTFISEKAQFALPNWLKISAIYEVGFFSLAIFATLIFCSCIFLIHQLKHLNLLQMLEQDPLTGIMNRHAMESKIDRALKRCAQSGEACSILLFDIDNFKKLNDNYGHLVGDVVLKHVANTVQDSLRPTDMLFRFGGEEFLLCLPNTSSAEALKIAERLRQQVANSAPASHPDRFVTISIGLVTETAKGKQEQTLHTSKIQWLVEQADAALYQAKRTGRNKTVQANIIEHH